MKNITVVDAAAIVAAIDRKDQWHQVGARIFSDLPKPLLTCEPCIMEAWFLLGESKGGAASVLTLLHSGIISVDFSLASEIAAVEFLLNKYSDIPMSLADACIVRMSEVFDAPVFTFDSDFRIYRRNRRGVIPLIGIDN